MAAPTAFRVEATSISTVKLYWTYAGANPIGVYRSTDGVSYSEVALSAGTVISPGTTSYTDTGLSAATKYWYKLSDDLGGTFSSVVTVFTQTCGVPPSGIDDATMPRAADEVNADTFNDLAVRVEAGLTRFTDPTGRICTACVSGGALVLDCVNYDNCEHIEVLVDQDINSISLPNCTNDNKIIDFQIPPNVTRGICGWPAGSGFSGDECTQAPIVGGSTGRTVSVGTGLAKANPKATGSRPGLNRTGSGGGGGNGGSSCTCVPNGIGALTIKSCNANNSMNCASTKSLKLIACGGLGPYTWTHTGSVNLSATTGATTTVTPPTNSGSGVAGIAYKECHFGNNGAFGCGTTEVTSNDNLEYGCNDQLLQCQSIDNVGCITPGNAILPCITGLGTCSIPQCDACGTHKDFKQPAVDRRTAPMIAAGCNPCGVSSGATVTVTDALGVQTTIILRN